MWRFTPGQVTRMHSELELYKPKLYKAAQAIANAPAPPAPPATPPPPPATPSGTPPPPTPGYKGSGSSGSGSSGSAKSGSDTSYGYGSSYGNNGYGLYDDDDDLDKIWDTLDFFGDDDGYSYADDGGYFDYAYYDDDALMFEDIVKKFAAKWGWTDWVALAADGTFADGSGASAIYAWSGSGSFIDFSDEFLPGSCSATDCGVRNFDRTCACEASCVFFRDCCSDYKAVCDAVKVERQERVAELKASKAGVGTGSDTGPVAGASRIMIASVTVAALYLGIAAIF